MKYLVPEVVKKINVIINKTKEIVTNMKLNFDEIYKESSKEMRPKSKSSKLLAILDDIGRTSLQAGN